MDNGTRRLYEVFSPLPLSTGQNDLYVDLEAVRGEHHVVKKLSGFIKLSPDKPTCYVLTGHKGCGKSTELMRLKSELEADDFPYYVVYCDVYQNLDLNDVDFPDLLLEIVRQLAEDLRDRAKIELKPAYLNELLARIEKALITEIGIDSVEIGGDIGKITAKVKDSPDARQIIRKVLEPRTNSLLEAANDIIGKAALELSKRGMSGLVLLVDNLDKMTVRPKEAGNCDTAEYLFINRAAQMTALQCHVVYTMPISLAYSHQAQNIKNQYGGQLPFVPATKVSGPPPEYKPYKPGIAGFRKIVEKRLAEAGTSIGDAFEDESVLEDLIRASGGQPTELMMMMREAIVDGLPIRGKTLEGIKRDSRREYSRTLLKEHYAVIEEVAKGGRFEPSEETEDEFRQLLNNRAILQYSNDSEWYGLNPAVADLLKQREA